MPKFRSGTHELMVVVLVSYALVQQFGGSIVADGRAKITLSEFTHSSLTAAIADLEKEVIQSSDVAGGSGKRTLRILCVTRLDG